MRLPPQVELDLQAVENELDRLNTGQKAGPTRLRGLRSSIEAALRSQPAPAERTCATCRHWEALPDDNERGQCSNRDFILMGGNVTPQTFGCSLWAGPQARQEQE